MGNHSRLSGTFDPSNTDIELKGTFPSLAFGKNTWYNVNSHLDKADGRLRALIESDSTMMSGGFILYNQDFELTAGYDTATMDLTWASNQGPEYSGDIRMTGTFQSDSSLKRGFSLAMHPGRFVMNDTTWKVMPASMLVKKGYLNLKDFEISSSGKKIMAHGVISSDEQQNFNLEMENLNLDQLNRLTGMNMELQGKATGKVHYLRVDSIPIIISNLEIDSLVFNRQLLGTTSLDASWDDSRKGPED